MNFFEKAWRVTFNPRLFFSTLNETGIKDALVYYIVFYFIEFLSVSAETLASGKDFSLLSLVSFPIVVVSIFVSTLVLQICTRIFGGSGDYSQSFMAIVYSMTPALLFSAISIWLPISGIMSLVVGFVGLLASLYSLAALHTAVMMRHGMGYWKAWFAIFLPSIVIAAIVLAILAIVLGGLSKPML
jgi:hypothetical protein